MIKKCLDNPKNINCSSFFKGHTSGIKQVLFNTDERKLISCADDKTLRFWDITSGQEIKKYDLTSPVGGIELSKDQDILTVAHGQTVSFFNAETFEKIKDVSIPSTVFTASLLYGRRIFVCGGDDFKLYKYNYDSGTEIGKNINIFLNFYVYHEVSSNHF